jgi:uncharacterized protein YjbI with pentapeptide repeats
MCLAHASEEDSSTALKLIGESGEIDARGVHITPALLERILGAAPRGEHNEPLIKACQFAGATFSGPAGFKGVTFSGDAWFERATFDDSATFRGATFSGPARFGEAAFSSADFAGTTFRGDAGFARAAFSRNAVFSGAAFSGDAWLDQVRFTGAGFAGTTFGGDAVFNGSTFSKDVWFDRATFSRTAWFDQVIFSGTAGFDRVTFNGNAGFGAAIFKGEARFGGVRFEQARQFGPVLAYRVLVLDDVQFAQPVQIEVSATGMCCRRARFPGGVQFRLRWARVVLDDTDLAAPSILAGIPRLSSEYLTQMEEQIAADRQQELADEISGRPLLVSLRRANVAGLGLSNVSAANCHFAGTHNLDKLRLESGVSFTTAPSPLGLNGYRWSGMQVIAEERAWRARRSRRHWVAPQWPAWLDDQRPDVLDPGQIAGLYRALRKGREDAKDEPGAADFYYGEMEMRRHARPSDDPTGQSDATSRGRVERTILTAYWLASGYSLRAWRAVTCLAVVTALLAVAFHLVGFIVPPHPVSYWTSLLYAFRSTLSLTDNEVTLTAWGQLLQGILRLTGPVLLGLALLALRGRVKR